jgi:hypothetical protein
MTFNYQREENWRLKTGATHVGSKARSGVPPEWSGAARLLAFGPVWPQRLGIGLP